MKTKVIIINTVGLIYDGITNVVLSYLEAMDLSKLEVYVVATNKVEPNIREKIEKIGCYIVPLPSRRSETVRYFWQLSSFIRKNNIKVMHAHGNSGTLAVEMVAGWLGGCKKRIAHSHNTCCEQVKADKLLRPIFNLLYTDALACGIDAGRWLFGNRNYIVLQNGRNIDKFSFNEQVRKAVRSKYNLNDELVIGHVGSFCEQKNHKFLLEVHREILKIEPSAKLFMIGDGPLKPEIELQGSDILDNIIFTGTTDEVADYLQAMDGMLLPSLFEGLPLVAIEWQINGLACIFANTITKDCVFTDAAIFMSLNDPAKMWASTIINMVKQNNRFENAVIAKEKVKKAGFDIKEEADKLKNIYTNNSGRC